MFVTTISEIIEVLTKLAEGVDPITGATLPPQAVTRHPYIVEALQEAAFQLGARPTSELERPINAGSAWSQTEDQHLATEIGSHMSLVDIAAKHERSPGAIIARTVRLGLFQTRDEARIALKNPARPSSESLRQSPERNPQ